jgi:hypothetical protein
MPLIMWGIANCVTSFYEGISLSFKAGDLNVPADQSSFTSPQIFVTPFRGHIKVRFIIIVTSSNSDTQETQLLLLLKRVNEASAFVRNISEEAF